MDPEVNERFERLEGIAAAQLDEIAGLLKLAAENEREHARLRELQETNEGELSVLIRMMDEWIRSQRNGRRRPRHPKKR